MRSEGSVVPPVSGISIVRNATLLDYPVEAALRSVLPLCDELLVNVGDSRDDTLERVRALADPRIRILERDWGEERGRTTAVHSQETNRALDLCAHDWALYIQADEVLHEDDLPAVRTALAGAARRPDVEGLVFDYLHFYGSPGWVVRGRRWYRREVRLLRRSSGARSRAGAQGFRVPPRERPVRAVSSGARVFHYGYAKSLRALRERRRLWARYQGADEEAWGQWEFERLPGLRPFDGTHPGAARDWIESRHWPFRPEDCPRPRWTLRGVRSRLSDAIERLSGRRPLEHRNYVLLE
ncbi:MAG: glycosyltransferase [Gemmatimonadota bacterium]|nr:glycosyltransferase [Gemmatimonadota bacterium]